MCPAAPLAEGPLLFGLIDRRGQVGVSGPRIAPSARSAAGSSKTDRKCVLIAAACFSNQVVAADWLACAEQSQALDREFLRPLVDRFYQLSAPLFMILVAAQIAQGQPVPKAFAARLRPQMAGGRFRAPTPIPLYSLARLNPEDF